MTQTDNTDLVTRIIPFQISPYKLTLEPNFLKKFPAMFPAGKYVVNLHQLECTCDEFEITRKEYQEGDVRRMCKH